jgi:hypothetical protein
MSSSWRHDSNLSHKVIEDGEIQLGGGSPGVTCVNPPRVRHAATTTVGGRPSASSPPPHRPHPPPSPPDLLLSVAVAVGSGSLTTRSASPASDRRMVFCRVPCLRRDRVVSCHLRHQELALVAPTMLVIGAVPLGCATALGRRCRVIWTLPLSREIRTTIGVVFWPTSLNRSCCRSQPLSFATPVIAC